MKNFPIEIVAFPGIVAKVTKMSDNGGRFSKNDIIQGIIYAIPIVGFRFKVIGGGKGNGGLNTNLVTEILEYNNEGGKFVTYSESVYAWEVIDTYKDERMHTTDISKKHLHEINIKLIEDDWAKTKES